MYLFIFMWVIERRERESFPPLVHSPNGNNSWSWSDLKPGASSFLGLPCGCRGSKDLGHPALPSWPKAENWIESGTPRAWTTDHMGCWCRWKLSLLCKSTVPMESFIVFSSQLSGITVITICWDTLLRIHLHCKSQVVIQQSGFYILSPQKHPA